MPYNVFHVSNSFLERAFKEARRDVTPLKLQKLVYFLNGWHLAITGEPAINEPFQAWQYGPVSPSLYQEFKEFGREGITRYAREFDPASGTFKSYKVGVQAAKFYEILDAVWERYVGYSPITLSAMTHQEGSPWCKAFSEGGKEISSSDIKDYFVTTVMAENASR